jgi:hypothetical protein
MSSKKRHRSRPALSWPPPHFQNPRTNPQHIVLNLNELWQQALRVEINLFSKDEVKFVGFEMQVLGLERSLLPVIYQVKLI